MPYLFIICILDTFNRFPKTCMCVNKDASGEVGSEDKSK